jgi:hypothetical protein
VSEDHRTRLAEEIEMFNRRGESYFELYDRDVVLHGYPEGVAERETMRGFYRSLCVTSRTGGSRWTTSTNSATTQSAPASPSPGSSR